MTKYRPNGETKQIIRRRNDHSSKDRFNFMELEIEVLVDNLESIKKTSGTNSSNILLSFSDILFSPSSENPLKYNASIALSLLNISPIGVTSAKKVFICLT